MPNPRPRHFLGILSTAALALFFSSAALADPAAHRQLASEVLDVVNTPVALRTAMSSAVGPLLERMRAEGAPEEAIREIKAAMLEWADKEIVWDEVKPQLIDLYVREFTEDELRQLLAFYRTPVGAKTLSRFPVILSEGSRIGREYAESKQASLEAKLEKIAAKYHASRRIAGPAHGHAH